jgi:hypothetical protein
MQSYRTSRIYSRHLILKVEGHIQNVNAPEMAPFAMLTGNRKYPRRVIGNDRAANIGGGMTSRNLRVSGRSQRQTEGYVPIHGQVMMHTMHEEVESEECGRIR